METRIKAGAGFGAFRGTPGLWAWLEPERGDLKEGRWWRALKGKQSRGRDVVWGAHLWEGS